MAMASLALLTAYFLRLTSRLSLPTHLLSHVTQTLLGLSVWKVSFSPQPSPNHLNECFGGRGSVGGARAQYFCKDLPDQDEAHYFSTPLYGEDTRTSYSGMLSYACNHSSGGVTYKQNMSYIFDYSGGENVTTGTYGDIFRLDFSTLSFLLSPRSPFPCPMRPHTCVCNPPCRRYRRRSATGIEFCLQTSVRAERCAR